jgi:hypothetical protein
MNIPSIDIKDMLVDDSDLELIYGTNLFVGKEPSSPNNTVTIFDTYGYGPQLTLDKTGDYYYQSIQIRVRNTSYVSAMELGQNIVDSLHSRAGERWSGTLYTLIKNINGPAILDYDENNRVHIIMNFNLQRRI